MGFGRRQVVEAQASRDAGSLRRFGEGAWEEDGGMWQICGGFGEGSFRGGSESVDGFCCARCDIRREGLSSSGGQVVDK